jgi:hypothetical protein
MRVPIGTAQVFQDRRLFGESNTRDHPAVNRPVGTARSLFIVLAILARLRSVSPSGTRATPWQLGLATFG